MPERAPVEYTGDAASKAPITAALRSVVDPEAALSILDLGLVLSVMQQAEALDGRVTMTSAARPVADIIVEDGEQALDRVLSSEVQTRVGPCPDEVRNA